MGRINHPSGVRNRIISLPEQIEPETLKTDRKTHKTNERIYHNGEDTVTKPVNLFTIINCPKLIDLASKMKKNSKKRIFSTTNKAK